MPEFFNSDVFAANAEMVVVPMSTVASVSHNFADPLNAMGIAIVLPKKRYQLGDIELQKVEGAERLVYLAYACCVQDFTSDYATIRIIGVKLARAATQLNVRTIATPILGSGAGGLDSVKSRNILRNAFNEADENNTGLTFCTPDTSLQLQFAQTSPDTAALSAQLVIEAELKKTIEIDYIQELLNKEDFYYALAKEKFDQFNAYPRERPFFTGLLGRFTGSRQTFQLFLPTLTPGTDEYRFFVICGELIAYIDSHAYRKNLWNQYPDKRVLARSGVNQTNWLINLLRFKADGLSALRGGSIINAILYLQEPEAHLTMLSEQHRQKVVELFLLPGDGSLDSAERIIKFFNGISLSCRYRLNLTALYSRILYLPWIKRMWFDQGAEGDDAVVLTGVDGSIDMATALIQHCLESGEVELDLGKCGLSDLSLLPELFECVQLEELILSNQWAEFSKGKWRDRKSRNSGKNNQLRHLPDGFRHLVNLRRLYAGGDWKQENGEWDRGKIKNVKSLAGLKKLEYLNLSNNAIGSIKQFESLTGIRILHINNNYIADASPLRDLDNLRELYLSNNLLSDISFFQDIDWLDTLDLHHNEIRDIRPLEKLIAKIGIRNKKWEQGTINIAQNPLEIPSMSLVELGKEEVLTTLRDLRIRGHYENKDVKVVLIGNSEAGKSTMAKYLDERRELQRPHPATHGMIEKLVKSKYDIKKIGKQCDLHLFDFGGHDYYHDTHHVFFSRNTVYLLLWDRDTEKLRVRTMVQKNQRGDEVQVQTQDYPVNYWLESVKFFSKDVEAENIDFKTNKEKSYTSSLLMLQNKVRGRADLEFKDNKELAVRFPFIYEFLNISIINPERSLDHFDRQFTDMLNEMDIIGEILPEYYRVIKEALALYNGLPVLDDQGFLDFCNGLLVDPLTLEQSIIVARYLDQVGLLICKKIGEQRKICVNKKWVIDNIYKVLDGLTHLNGEFNFVDASGKLGFDEAETRELLDLMTAFKMIFRHPSKGTFIAPLYLPEMPPANINLFLRRDSRPYRRFEYCGYIHKHIILTLYSAYGQMVKSPGTGSLAENSFYWKDALIVKDAALEEIVMIKFNLGDDKGNAHIDVYNVNEVARPSFIHTVLATIRDLNKGYETEEMVRLTVRILFRLRCWKKMRGWAS